MLPTCKKKHEKETQFHHEDTSSDMCTYFLQHVIVSTARAFDTLQAVTRVQLWIFVESFERVFLSVDQQFLTKSQQSIYQHENIQRRNANLTECPPPSILNLIDGLLMESLRMLSSSGVNLMTVAYR